MWTKWSRAPVSRAASSAERTASSSVTGGRDLAQSSAVRRPSARACSPSRSVWDGVLRVQREQRPRTHFGAALHRFDQREAVEVRELGQATVAQKGFDADHARFLQLGQVVERIGHQAAPQRVVHQRVLGNGAALDGQRAAVECWRVTVQRHVADGGDAAGGRGRGARDEPLPVGATGLVEVHVRVDQTGQDVQAAGVDARVGGAAGIARHDGLHTSVLEQQVGLTH